MYVYFKNLLNTNFKICNLNCTNLKFSNVGLEMKGRNHINDNHHKFLLRLGTTCAKLSDDINKISFAF